MNQEITNNNNELNENSFGENASERIHLECENFSKPLATMVENQEVKEFYILLVEDNKIIQMVTKNYLEGWSLKVDIASDGQEATEFVLKRQYDLILMDIHMPRLDGWDATKVIRDIESYSETPIIALTGSVGEFEYEIEEAGMNDIIYKPFGPAELKKTLFKYINTNHFIKDGANDYLLLGNIQTIELEKLSIGDSQFYEKVLKLYIEQFHNFPGQLKEALQNNDIVLARSILHKIKPSLKMLHIDTLERMVQEVHEHLHTDKNLELITGKVELLFSISKQVEHYLESKI